jgi:glycosyltransferase involved in cell wall biosynthesis
MKKILYFIQMPPPHHGVSILNKIIYESDMVNKGFERILLPIKFSNTHEDINKVTIKKLINMFLLNVKLFITILIKKPDCIYFTLTPIGSGFLRDLLFISTMKIFKTKRIYHLHGVGILNQIQRKPRLQHLYNYAFNNSSIIHLSDGLLKSEITNSFLDIKYKGFVVNNGIDEEKNFFHRKKEDVRLLFLSNLFPSKGIFDVLRAFKIISEQFPDVYLDIAGGSSGRDVDNKIENIVNAYNLKSKIVFHGFLSGDEKVAIFNSASIFVHPTYNDAFPLVLLEAMKYGLPIISTRIGAISEIVINNKTGYLIDCGDYVELANKCIKLIGDEKEYKSMSKMAQKVFKEQYTLEKFQNNMKTVFQEICRK